MISSQKQGVSARFGSPKGVSQLRGKSDDTKYEARSDFTIAGMS
jgi:hypothetical protein